MSQITAVILGSGGAGPITTLTGNSGGAVAPSAGNINILGSGILAVTGNPGTHTLTISATNPIPIANGGTNATSMANTFGVNYFDGTRIVTTAVGTAGQVLTSNGAGVAPTFQAGGGGGGGITTIDGDTSSVTGATVSFMASSTGNTLAFTPSSATQMNLNNFDGNGNYAVTDIGSGNGPTGSNNVILGVNAGDSLSGGGDQNVAIGTAALGLIGSNNVAIGYLALGATGSSNQNFNIGIGEGVGPNYNNSESSNILINAVGGSNESNHLYIGNGTGTGNQQLVASYISGIFGKSVDAGTGTAVLVDTNNKLGTALSSERYKFNIEDMDDYSDDIHNLRCVTFKYKEYPDALNSSVGLIAEEVENQFPALVVKDKEGAPMTVKYLDLIPMLLNEVQKLRKELDTLKKGV